MLQWYSPHFKGKPPKHWYSQCPSLINCEVLWQAKIIKMFWGIHSNVHWLSECSLKVALQILGRKFYKNTKKSSLYSQCLLIFIHRTPAVKRYPITRAIRDLLWPRSTPTRNKVYFYMSSSFIYTLKIHRRRSTMALDDDIMENN